MFSLWSYCKFCVFCDAKVRWYGMLTLSDTSPSRALCRLQNDFSRMYWPFLFLSPRFSPWPKWSSYIACWRKVCQALKIEILLHWLLSACRERNIVFYSSTWKFIFSENNRKSLSPTQFGSLSTVDWYRAVCLVLCNNVKAGNLAIWVFSLRLRVR